MALNPQAPYVGASAFAHKAGLHVSAIAKRPDAYEHVAPDSVGNGTRFVVSELAGKSTLVLKAKELGLDARRPAAQRGRRHAEADGARGLPLRGRRRVARAAHAPRRPAGSSPGSEVESFRVITDDDDPSPTPPRAASPPRPRSRCTSTASASIATAEGNGPVNALDTALRERARRPLPGARSVHLTDYKVRVLDTAQGHRRRHPGADRLHQRRAHRGPPSA